MTTRKSSKNAEDYISVYTNSLQDILDDENQFSIPFNQRPWAWNNDRLLALWNDIKETRDNFYNTHEVENSRIWESKLHTNAIDPHFFGALVFVETAGEDNKKRLEVVDGQQRLTSLTMVAAVIKEIRLDLLTSASNPQQKKKALNALSQISGWIERDEDPIILADEQYRALYQALIVESSNQKDREDLIEDLPDSEKDTKEHKHLIKSFNYIRDLILEDSKDMSWDTKDSFFKSILETISTRFIVIVSYIMKESFSYKVFSTLNAKGQKLTPTDNIKSELFNLTKSQFHSNISIEWRKLKSNCLRGDIGDFLRKRHVALYGSCTAKGLYDVILAKELKNKNVIDVLKEWCNDAKLLKDVQTSIYPGIDKKTSDNIQALKTLGITLSEIMILRSAKLFLPNNKNAFSKVVKLTLDFSFRKITICGDKTSDLDKAFAAASKALSTDPKSVDNVVNTLRNYSSDSDFTTKFANHSQINTKLQYYILFEIEKYLSGSAGVGLQPYPHSCEQHIEHILPQKLSKANGRETEWQWARNDPDLHKNLINKIGNLMILEADINNIVSNHSFDSKKTGFYLAKQNKKLCYQDSKLKLPAELLASQNYPDWTEATIKKRQNDLAAIALKIWSLN